jgi:signal transduction histidine kinase
MQVKLMSSSKPFDKRWYSPSLSDLRFYIWVIVLHALLFYPLAPLLTTDDKPWARRLAIVILVVVFALLHWLVMFRQPQWRSRVERMVPFLLSNLALTTVLVWLDPSYTFLFLFISGYAFRFLPIRWAVLICILTVTLVIAGHLGPVLEAPSLSSLFQALSSSAGLVFGVLVVAWIVQFARQSRERRALLERLQTTQSELAAAERQAGILEERARLAREIHDTLAQGLVSIVMHLEAADQALSGDTPAASQHLDQARRAARDNLAEARRFVWALQPEALERDALPKALACAAERWSDEIHIPVAISVTGDTCALAPEFEVTLLRVAQEALANVSKHAHARQVNLTLSYMNDQVVMDVNDDGVGFDLTQLDTDRQADSFGLAGMRQRVERLGGRLSIESAVGEGTTLVVAIPILNRENN